MKTYIDIELDYFLLISVMNGSCFFVGMKQGRRFVMILRKEVHLIDYPSIRTLISCRIDIESSILSRRSVEIHGEVFVLDGIELKRSRVEWFCVINGKEESKRKSIKEESHSFVKGLLLMLWRERERER